MSPFNSEGNNRQEDIRLRSITRGRLTAALAQEAIRTAQIVTALLGRINEKQFREASVERLWSAVQNHQNLADLKLTIERLTGAYPEFQTQVIAARTILEREQRARIEREKAPQIIQQRFGNARVHPSCYAAA
jgi:hypothetical protein